MCNNLGCEALKAEQLVTSAGGLEWVQMLAVIERKHENGKLIAMLQLVNSSVYQIKAICFIQKKVS